MSGGWRSGPIPQSELKDIEDGCLWLVFAIFVLLPVGIIAYEKSGVLTAAVTVVGVQLAICALTRLRKQVINAGPGEGAYSWLWNWHHNRYMTYIRRVHEGQHPFKAKQPFFVRFWGKPLCSSCGGRTNEAPLPRCSKREGCHLPRKPLWQRLLFFVIFGRDWMDA
jgi:hypothetical protein